MDPRRGVIECAGLRLPCALGRSGRQVRKREGDGATPVGRFRLVHGYARRDKVGGVRSALSIVAIRPGDGWCDAAADRNYNRAVRLPYPASAEAMWRGDGLYDIVVVISHNRRPRVRGHGSAIFMHVARQGYQPTEGCIALSLAHIKLILERTGADSQLIVPA